MLVFRIVIHTVPAQGERVDRVRALQRRRNRVRKKGWITLFTYTTIFVACIIMAIAAVGVYKAVSMASRLVSRTRLSDSEAPEPTAHLMGEPMRLAVISTPSPWGRENRQTPENLARTNAARPFEQTPWGGKVNGFHYAPRRRRVDHAGHWTPYDTDDSKTASVREQSSSLIHREDRCDPSGKSYRVSRSLKPRKAPVKPISKPSNW